MPLPLELAPEADWHDISGPPCPNSSEVLVRQLQRRLEDQNKCFWEAAQRREEASESLIHRLAETEAELSLSEENCARGEVAFGRLSAAEAAVAELRRQLADVEAELSEGREGLLVKRQSLDRHCEDASKALSEQQKRAEVAQRRVLQEEGKARGLVVEVEKQRRSAKHREGLLAEVRQQLEDSQSEIMKLRGLLQAQSAQARSTSDELVTLRRAVEERHAACEAAQMDLRKAQEAKASHVRETADSCSADAEALRKVVEVEAEVGKYEEELKAYAKGEAQFSSVLFSKDQEMRRWADEARQANTDREAARSRLQELHTEFAAREAERSQLELAAQERAREVHSAEAGRYTILEEARRLEAEVSKVFTKCAEHATSLSRQARMASQRDEATCKLQAECAAEESAASLLEQKLTAAHARLGEERELASRSEAAASSSVDEARVAVSEALASREKASHSQAKLASAEAALASLTTELAQRTPVEQLIRSAEEEANLAEKQIQELEVLLAAEQQEIEEEERDAGRLAKLSEEQLGRAQAELEDVRLRGSKLDSALEKSEAQLQECMASRNRATQECRSETRDALSRAEAAEALLDETTRELERAQDTLSMATRVAARTVEARGELQEARSEIHRLEERCNKARQGIADRNIEIQRLTQESATMEQRAAEVESQSETLRTSEARLEETETRAQRRKSRLRTVEEEIARLEEKRIAAAQEIQELRAYAAAGAAALDAGRRNPLDQLERTGTVLPQCHSAPNRGQRRDSRCIPGKKQRCNPGESDSIYDCQLYRSFSVGDVRAHAEKVPRVISKTPPKTGLPQLSLPNGLGRSR